MIGPCRADRSDGGGLEGPEVEDHIGIDCGEVAGFDVDCLADTCRVVGGITGSNGLAEKGSGIWIDDDGSPGIEIEYCTTHFHGIVVKERWRHDTKANMWRVRLDDFVRDFNYEWTDEGRLGFIIVGCDLAVKVDDPNDQRAEVLLDVEKGAPEDGQNGEDGGAQYEGC